MERKNSEIVCNKILDLFWNAIHDWIWLTFLFSYHDLIFAILETFYIQNIWVFMLIASSLKVLNFY